MTEDGKKETEDKKDLVKKPEINPGSASTVHRPPSTAPDPTRYGDWELKGKCVDF